MKAFIIILAFFLLSCKPSSNSISEAINNETISAENSEILTAQTPNDTTQITESVINFVHWYKDNYQKVNGVTFVGKDKIGNYIVNLEECKKYLSYLSASGYLSKEYVTEWNKYFESKAEYFTTNPTNEGPPEGFDYDLVLITQEPEIVWNTIDTIKMEVSDIKDGKAIAKIENAEIGYEFEMIRENEKWKISYIATMNYD